MTSTRWLQRLLLALRVLFFAAALGLQGESAVTRTRAFALPLWAIEAAEREAEFAGCLDRVYCRAAFDAHCALLNMLWLYLVGVFAADTALGLLAPLCCGEKEKRSRCATCCSHAAFLLFLFWSVTLPLAAFVAAVFWYPAEHPGLVPPHLAGPVGMLIRLLAQPGLSLFFGVPLASR
jgi:hypothetical protein